MKKSGYDENGNLRFATVVIKALGIFISLFTVVMVVIYCVKENVPDSLVYGVFGLAAAEATALVAKRIFTKKKEDSDFD